MKKNIDLIIDGIAPEKVMYDTNNHSLVVLYPAQKEFKVGDKVRLKKDLNLKVGEYYNGMSYLKSMDDVKDAVLTVECIPTYDMLGCINNIDNNFWCYHKEWLEHIVEDEVKFKRGDIVISQNNQIGIFDSYDIDDAECFDTIWMYSGIYKDKLINNGWIAKYFALATHEEQQVLFDVLAKEGKKWNAETLEIEDIKPEFRRGDILASDNMLLIFDKYEMFNQEKDFFHSIWNNWGVAHNKKWTTKNFKHATDEQKAQVHELLKKDGKRWNRDTLEVEDIKPEFKRGDIVIYDNTSRVAIFDEYVNSTNKKDFKDITSMMNISNGKYVDVTFNKQWNTDTLRMATDNEAKLLFDLLKKIGKRWNKETLEIEDLDISEIAIDWITACEYLKEPMPRNYIYDAETDFEKQINTQIELQMIRKAWNKFDGFVVDWDDYNQLKYSPIFKVEDRKIEFSRISIIRESLDFHTSSFSFKSEERVIQFGNQFKELFKTAMGL